MNQYEKKVAKTAMKADPACANFDDIFSRISAEIGVDTREVESVLHRLVLQGILCRREGPTRDDSKADRMGWYEKGDAWPD